MTFNSCQIQIFRQWPLTDSSNTIHRYDLINWIGLEIETLRVIYLSNYSNTDDSIFDSRCFVYIAKYFIGFIIKLTLCRFCLSLLFPGSVIYSPFSFSLGILVHCIKHILFSCNRPFGFVAPSLLLFYLYYSPLDLWCGPMWFLQCVYFDLLLCNKIDFLRSFAVHVHKI